MTTGPLSGVKVLEFTQIITGPFCGMHLAYMGAEVTKFEPFEGEPSQRQPVRRRRLRFNAGEVASLRVDEDRHGCLEAGTAPEKPGAVAFAGSESSVR